MISMTKLRKIRAVLAILWLILGISATVLLLTDSRRCTGALLCFFPAAAGALLAAETAILFRTLEAFIKGSVNRRNRIAVPFSNAEPGVADFDGLPDAAAEANRCPVCGSRLDADARACPECGTPV